ncbi:MAG: hypothetical protein EOO97_00100 [Pedobacter sp.]|nr:MAG: hypothetical protein EOO97_00100 [Pedobacter sp.]
MTIEQQRDQILVELFKNGTIHKIAYSEATKRSVDIHSQIPEDVASDAFLVLMKMDPEKVVELAKTPAHLVNYCGRIIKTSGYAGDGPKYRSYSVAGTILHASTLRGNVSLSPTDNPEDEQARFILESEPDGGMDERDQQWLQIQSVLTKEEDEFIRYFHSLGRSYKNGKRMGTVYRKLRGIIKLRLEGENIPWKGADLEALVKSHKDKGPIKKPG